MHTVKSSCHNSLPEQSGLLRLQEHPMVQPRVSAWRSKFVHYSIPVPERQHDLVSKDGRFELGFFNPGSSKNRYLGIWFKNIPVQTVVWVANRLKPINDSSGVLMLNSSGSLVLLSQNSTIVAWSANSTNQASNPIVQLLDSGNLVVRDEKEQNPKNYLWQSFDYPCDTLLPGMKLGWDLRTGQEWRLSAWKSPEDPSPRELTFGIRTQ
uniref:Bulb-type lectin domain-containing protein n=1 Tax=Fagus sylvatica TaxID=28930 RepID=A0A2N9GRA8_FAGSY